MKKLLRLILIFLVFALMAALSAITALACSPDDNNPEHHENVIQTEEKKPTCLEGGYYVLECTVCRWSCAFSIGDIVPHEFGPWEIVPGKEPTCTKAGEKRAYCSTCNKWYPELAPATGHSWYKYYTKEPTCTTAGEYYTYCRNCPASQGRSTEPATGHFWVVWKRVFATCTTPGYTEFVCDDCGADGGTTTTPAKGHSFGAWFTTTQPTCMETGIQKRECTQCSVTETKPIAKTDHNWDAGKVVAQPTTSQEGVMQWICNMCGTIRTNPIPKLKPGTTAAPRTTPTPAPTAPPRTAATATPKASPTASPNTAASASPGISPTASPGASISGTADSDGKNGDRGEKSGFGEDAVGKDVPQKQEKNNVQAAERSFSVGKILVFTLVPTLLIVAIVVFLLVWRKKKRQF